MFQYHFKARKSKKHAQPKEFYQEYIDTGPESVGRTHISMPTKFEMKLHGSINELRRDFKKATKKILNRRSGRKLKDSIYETERLEELAKLSHLKGRAAL